MIKKSAMLLLFVLIFSVLTGCVQWRTNIVVNSNGSVEVTQLLGMTKEMAALSNDANSTDSFFTNERKEELMKKGYEVEGYKDGPFTGYKVKKKFKNMEEMLKSELFEGIGNSNIADQFDVKVEKGIIKNIITVKGNIDLAYNKSSEKDELESLANMMLSSLDLGMSITLPVKAKASNADYVDGKTYTWDFMINEKNPIELQVETWNITNILIISGIILLFIFGIIMAVRKKRKSQIAS